MICPICGFKMGENDAFCSNCGNFALPLKEHDRPVPVFDPPPGTPTDDSAVVPTPPELQSPAPKQPRKVAERLYPPQTNPAPLVDLSVFSAQPESDAPHTDFSQDATPPEPSVFQTPAAPTPAPKKSAKHLKILTIAACCLAVIAIGVAAYVLVSTSSLRAQLNRAQKESFTAQANAAELETQVSALRASLEAARADSQSLGAQVASLQSQLSDMETSVNQSLYDKDSALRQLEEAKTEKEAMQAQLTEAQDSLKAAQEDNETLREENETLSQQVTDYQAQVDFYDTYVVFVMLDSTDKYYHRYHCGNFTRRNFLAYSVKLAEANGYAPCPNCYGG